MGGVTSPAVSGVDVFQLAICWTAIRWDAVQAIADIVAVFVTLGVGILAWRGIQSQIDAAAKQQLRALAANIRPRLHVTEIVVDPNNLNAMPRGSVENIGVGPAVGVRVDVWFFSMKAPGLDVANHERNAVVAARGQREARPPDVRGFPGSIGRDRSAVRFDLPPVQRLEIRVPEGTQLLAACRITYRDAEESEQTPAVSIVSVVDENGEFISWESLRDRAQPDAPNP